MKLPEAKEEAKHGTKYEQNMVHEMQSAKEPQSHILITS